MIRRTAIVLFSVLVPIVFSGCASIVSGQNQSVSVVTRHQDTELSGAKCTLVNDKGTWFATTPGSVTVRRSYSNLNVNCTASGVETGITTAKSSTKGMAFGNILFGGVIGVGVDVATGAAYDYPDVITVLMGQVTDSSPARAATSASPVSPASYTSQQRVEPVIAKTPMQPEKVSVPPTTVVATAPPPPATALSPPAQPVVAAPVSLGVGESELTISRMAREQCHRNPSPVLTAKGPGFETYIVSCSNGDSVSYRCEFGNCRALK